MKNWENCSNQARYKIIWLIIKEKNQFTPLRILVRLGILPDQYLSTTHYLRQKNRRKLQNLILSAARLIPALYFAFRAATAIILPIPLILPLDLSVLALAITLINLPIPTQNKTTACRQ